MHKGNNFVGCFDYSPILKVYASGSADKEINIRSSSDDKLIKNI
jgi:hypothetical protein